MLKAKQHNEFSLTFFEKQKFSIGDEVPSGVTDDAGSSYHFPGAAHVTNIECEWDGLGRVKYTVFVTHPHSVPYMGMF